MTCQLGGGGNSFKANATNEIVARIHARQGTGAATGVSGEGNWLVQANIATITCSVFRLDGPAPSTPVAQPTVVVASAVYDTPNTNSQFWTVDGVGWNFLHAIPHTAITAVGGLYEVVYTITLTAGLGSAVGVLKYRAVAE